MAIDMYSLDILDRLLEHDAWTTRQVLALAGRLGDEQLDQDFDIGHRRIRETMQHIIDNIEIWSDLMAGRTVRQMAAGRQSVAELERRFESAYGDFARIARELRDTQRLNDMYLDVLDRPPQEKSYAGTILHVITHDHMHRAEILHMLERMGVQDLIEGDVLSWEARRRGR